MRQTLILALIALIALTSVRAIEEVNKQHCYETLKNEVCEDDQNCQFLHNEVKTCITNGCTSTDDKEYYECIQVCQVSEPRIKKQFEDFSICIKIQTKSSPSPSFLQRSESKKMDQDDMKKVQDCIGLIYTDDKCNCNQHEFLIDLNNCVYICEGRNKNGENLLEYKDVMKCKKQVFQNSSANIISFAFIAFTLLVTLF